MSLPQNMTKNITSENFEQSWILLKVIRKMNRQILRRILQLSFAVENKENKEEEFLELPNSNHLQAIINDKAEAFNNANDVDKI